MTLSYKTQMRQIENNETLQMLNKLKVDGIIGIDSLTYLIENKEKVECYSGQNVLVIINYTVSADYVSVIPLSESFDVASLAGLIANKCAKPIILIDVQKLCEDCLNKINQIIGIQFFLERVFNDYAYTSGTVLSDKIDWVRFLTSDDESLFVTMTSERIPDRPPLSILFDLFVRKNQGHILGAFEDGKIVGYISYNVIGKNVYDVDYIYVVPEKRGYGFGKKLASGYANAAVKDNCIAYWSNAKNDTSVAIAKASGFEKIRIAYKFI